MNINRQPKLLFLALIGCFLGLTPIALGENGALLSTNTSNSGRSVEKIEWGETEKGFILISYPKDLKPTQTYHLNFWFPGTSGNPGLGIANQNLNYIEICFSYLAQKGFAAGEWAQKHWELCLEVEAYLTKRKGVTIGQRIVSGVSKGGWLAFDMSVVNPKGLDGVVIVAAGKSPRENRKLDFKNSSLSVLVCTGETDSNYPFSQMAEAYYQKSELRDYCYEEWLTQGHVSHISERVIEWFNVQAKKEESPEALQNYCDKLMKYRLAEGKKRDDPKDHYITLRHHLKSPAASYMSEDLRQTIITKGRDLAKDPAVAAWLKDYAILRKIVQADQEIYQHNPVTSVDMSRIKNHYLKLIENTQHTDLKIRAAYGYLRKAKDEAILLLQEKEKATPSYQTAEKELEALRSTLNKQRTKDPLLMEQFHKLAAEHGKRNSALAMNAFRQVEWHEKFTLNHPLIESLLKEGLKTIEKTAPHSGLSF